MSNPNDLVLKHYKKPLTRVRKGFGYYGAIMQTKDGEKIQCHYCGKLFINLAGHTWQIHGLRAAQYREKYQLARKTPLVSGNQEKKLRVLSTAWFKSLTPQEKEYQKKQARKGYWDWRKKIGDNLTQPKIALETKNKRGTCPKQLIEKIKEIAKKLGHTPSLKEFVGATGTQQYKHKIFEIYGSWNKAVKIAKLKKRQQAYKGGFRVYTDDELLEKLRLFAQENNKVPTETDFRKGMLPDSGIYVRRFGNMEKARAKARVYQFIDADVLNRFSGKPKPKPRSGGLKYSQPGWPVK